MEEKRGCIGKVWHNYRQSTCGRGAKYNEDGKWWCKIHLPSHIKTKNKLRDEKWEIQLQHDNLKRKIKDLERDVIELAVLLYTEGTNPELLKIKVESLVESRDKLKGLADVLSGAVKKPKEDGEIK
jgi:hypothetical protein